LTELSKTICELLVWKRPTFEQGCKGDGEHGRCIKAPCEESKGRD
jgi:hypothetical protein